MARSATLVIRIMCVSLCLALAGFTLRPANTFAAGEAISVSPSSGPVGSLFTVHGSGFTGTTVYVYFNNLLLGSAAVTSGNVNATFQVPNVPASNYSVSVYNPTSPAGFSQSATFTVTGAGVPLTNLSLAKYVQTNAGFAACRNVDGCTVQNVSGSTITYAISYHYVSAAAVSQVVINDTIAAGQAFVSASPACVPGPPAPSTGLVTVTCTLNNLPATTPSGSSGSISIITRPTANFVGVVTNQSCATESGFSGQACSNTTYVTVSGNSGINGTTQLCGTVTAYTPPVYGVSYGSITIGGQSFSIAPTAQITGATFGTTAPYNNVCIVFTFSNSQAVALHVTSNLAAVNVICGMLSVASPTYFVVGGFTYPVIASVYTGNTFLQGGQYCFLIQNNTIVGVLTGIPTSAHLATQGGYHRNLEIAS